MIFNYKPTKDAKTLEGRGAEYFAPLTELRGTELTTSILEKAIELKSGFYYIKDLTGVNYTGNDLPHSNYTYGSAIIAKRSSTVITVILLGIASLDAGRIAVNRYNGTTWSGWDKLSTAAELANYLSLTGGTVKSSGLVPIRIESTNAEEKTLLNFLHNGVNYGYLGFDGENNPVFVNNYGGTGAANVMSILHTGNMGDHALPKSGGEVNGNIQVKQYGATSALVGIENGHNWIFIGVNESGMAYVSDKYGNIFERPLNGSLTFKGKATGNGNPVHIGTSAPSDTTALWIDTSA